MRARRLGSTANLERKMDTLTSKVVHRLYSERCAMESDSCGGTLSPHHVIKRGNKMWRWKPINCVLLCWTHHRWTEEHPALFMSWLERALPWVHQWVRGRQGRPSEGRLSHADLTEQKEDLQILWDASAHRLEIRRSDPMKVRENPWPEPEDAELGPPQ